MLELAFMTCAAAGGAALVLQVALLLFGIGDGDADGAAVGHADGDHDAGDSAFNLLSVKAVTGFVAFFGLGGWWASSKGWEPAASTGVALSCGAVAMVVVAWMATWQRKLASSGTFEPRNAVGQVAQVYLRVPGHRAGEGKVTLMVQGRTVELRALTDGPEIPTGAAVVVDSIVGADACVVTPLAASNQPEKK
jgi:hypothetical protein